MFTTNVLSFQLVAFGSNIDDPITEDLRVMLLKGFHIIGALVVQKDGDEVQIASQAVDAAHKIRKCLEIDGFGETSGKHWLIGAVADIISSDIRFFVSYDENGRSLKPVSSVVYDTDPEQYVWETACLLHCKLPITLPLYAPLDKKSSKLLMICNHPTSLISFGCLLCK